MDVEGGQSIPVVCRRVAMKTPVPCYPVACYQSCMYARCIPLIHSTGCALHGPHSIVNTQYSILNTPCRTNAFTYTSTHANSGMLFKVAKGDMSYVQVSGT